MGETLKDDLRHLEHLRQNAHATHGKQQGRRVRWLQYHSKLQAMFERGDLIPRDEITPQMAAEVLLSGQGHAQAISRSLRQEGYLVPIAQVYAALTAIKEETDDDEV